MQHSEACGNLFITDNLAGTVLIYITVILSIYFFSGPTHHRCHPGVGDEASQDLS